MNNMKERVNAYIDWKKGLGYLFKVESGELLRFAKFADQLQFKGPLTTEIALKWAQEAKNCSRLYQARRIEIVRCLAKYEVTFYPSTEIPPRGIMGKAHIRKQPYIYSCNDIQIIMKAAHELQPTKSFRSRTAETFIGSLISTGMRVCEALKLQRSDVRLKEGTIFIRDTKYYKSRMIPVHQSTIRALNKYTVFRDKYRPFPESKRFFISEKGRDLPHSTICYIFQQIRKALPISNRKKRRKPRLYDFRHTFACNCLLNWYSEGIDIHKMISVLSTYLGHVKLSDTYWYLTGTQELFQLATERFEKFIMGPGVNL